MANIHSVSLGCPKNRVDLEKLLAAVPGMNAVPSLDGADCVVINTCAFIDPATRESVAAIANAIEDIAEKGIEHNGHHYNASYNKKYCPC